MPEAIEITASNLDPERLDTYLADAIEQYSRSRIKAWCKESRIEVDGKIAKASQKVSAGAKIKVTPEVNEAPDHIEPENIPLEVIHEDNEIIVINKPPGLVVHPGAGVHSGTLVNALAFHFGQLTERGGILRPGIVHRLDKGTSGIILVAKTDTAHKILTQQWQAGRVTKVYKALVWGSPEPTEDEITTHIGRHARFRHMMAAEVEGGRWSKSRYKVVEHFPEASLVNVHILTGRTHQIRVHMAHLGHPVVGDALYGRNRHKALAKTFPHMPEYPMLHAALLRFSHPGSGKEMTFKQEVPEAFARCAQALKTWPA